jgi:hypothetical protein
MVLKIVFSVPLTFYGSTSYGNLVNINWLKDEKCPLDEMTYYRAAVIGNLANI